jgi:hypothetical protein
MNLKDEKEKKKKLSGTKLLEKEKKLTKLVEEKDGNSSLAYQ